MNTDQTGRNKGREPYRGTDIGAGLAAARLLQVEASTFTTSGPFEITGIYLVLMSHID
jgi:hypothetical protein